MEADPSDIRLILSSCPTMEEAQRIAEALVASRQAACINILPGARSIYRWEEKVEHAQEVLLFIKTTAAHVENVNHTMGQMHSYAVPEFLVLDISSGSRTYLEWLLLNLK